MAGRRRQHRQFGEVGQTADIGQPPLLHQFVRHGDLVDRLVALAEGGARFVDPAVMFAEEVVGLNGGFDARHRFAVDQQRTEKRLFRIGVVRRERLRKHVRLTRGAGKAIPARSCRKAIGAGVWPAP
ncbi:MAG: hypothetical protein NTZ05_00775 [Chloroflexi bacterium]|nr:hypothetical protein [Chloroflexota bacterium]